MKLLHAEVGDQLIILSTTLDHPVRDGEILATGPDGGPPYEVRWADTGRTTLLFPGNDARVRALSHRND